jgi:hypothetical protein
MERRELKIRRMRCRSRSRIRMRRMDKYEDDGKEPQTIGQGEMVIISADDVDTMVDDKPIAPPVQGQQMREHTTRPQPPAPSPLSETLDTRPPTRIPETHPLSGLRHFRLVTPPQSPPEMPTLREAEAAGNFSDVDVDQQLIGELAGGNSLPDDPLSDTFLPDTHPDGSVGEKSTSARI